MSGPRALILGCAGPRLSPREAGFFREADPWGFILFSRNIHSPRQVAQLCDDLRAAVGRTAPILIDQEGGRVQRLEPPHWPRYLPPLDQMRAARDPMRAMWLRHRLIAAELYALGIDVNCAPLADIADDGTHPFLRNRCYGESPDEVAAAARAGADGLLAGGVLPVVKHIPGHGRARVDSHLGLPRVDAAIEELSDHDFAPFRALADLPMGMSAHVVYDALDPEAPATLSAEAIATIREEIGFDGLLMTDDISMGALSGPVEQRGHAALAAGCDVVLHCNGDGGEMAALAGACGLLDGDAERRANAALALRRSPEDADIEALRAELDGQLGSAEPGLDP
ncbi:MAG: beta-hexosaminidase [Proteobacteria bacterium]|nr:MAG: beta-hexosaminidase [Pseudomonadota bacterium]